MKDIAQRTGLGLATISKYLNGGNVLPENKKAIDEAVDALGYTINEFGRALKSNRSMTIGVLIPELSGLFITSIIAVVEDILRHSGYSTIICDCRSDRFREEEALEFLMQKRVDGIINMPTTSDGSHLKPAIARGIPVVLIDRMIPQFESQVHSVLVDNRQAARQATQLLLDQGHTNIGVLLGPKDTYTTKKRLAGYREAFTAAQTPMKESYIVHCDYTTSGGHQAMQALIATDITAVFTTNYETTLGAIIALNAANLAIPEDISLVGFDNMELAQVVRPPLTIVTQPVEEIGSEVARILLEELEEGGAKQTGPQHVVLPTTLRLGGSVAKQKPEGRIS